MEFQQIVQSAEAVKTEYAALHKGTGKPQWTAVEYAQGFVGDVGDLMKLVMAREGYREIDDMEARLAHELCDCLWSILILANEYEIDLESEFPAQMDAIVQRVRATDS